VKKLFSVAVLMGTSLALAQHPSDADVTALIEKGRQKALAYRESLPDFLATEVVRRYTGIAHHMNTVPVDTLTIQLRYFQHTEEHKLVLFNGEPTERRFDSLEGFVGTGEFGTTLSAIFDPASQTTFEWRKWKTLRSRPGAVLAYVVDVAHSAYRLESQIRDRAEAVLVSYQGVVELDVETGEVLRLEYEADHIPKELHIESVATSVDYALADIGGRVYLLPSHAESEVRGLEEWAKSVIKFQDYRKFTADSVVDFGPVK
jgi:hypothetical protein